MKIISRIPRPPAISPPWPPLFGMAASLTLCALLYHAVPFANGLNDAWQWPYFSFSIQTVATWMAPALLLTLGGLLLGWREGGGAVFMSLFCMAAGLVCATGGGLMADPRGLEMIPDIVASATTTSYYTDALRIDSVTEWLASFNPRDMHMHSATHPPGFVLLYYAYIQMAGAEGAPYLAAAANALAAAFSVFALYWFAGMWTRAVRPRLVACALWSLCPVLALTSPSFDQFYPLVVLLLGVFWSRAITRHIAWAIPFGLTLFVLTFLAYNGLVFGAFLAMYALHHLAHRRREGGFALALAQTAGASVIGLLTWGAIYGHLAMGLGFDPLAAFMTSLEVQAHLSGPELLNRQCHPGLGLLDIYDFALGGGLAPMLLAMTAAAFSLRRWKEDAAAGVNLAAVGTVFIVALSCLLYLETARVWLFLQPLAMVPAALFVTRTPGRNDTRESSLTPLGLIAAFLVCHWLALVVIKSRLVFIQA